jgi:hypothetical protein
MDFLGAFMTTIYQEFEEMDEEEADALSTRPLARRPQGIHEVCAFAAMANSMRL